MPYTARYKWTVMGIVMIGTFMSILDSSIVNVAVPHIMAGFGVNLDEAKWIITGYMLGYAVLMPITGWTREVAGLKRTFVWALAVFTAGSALCGVAWSNDSLIVARIIQAIGGGAIMPTGMTLITEVFEPQERGMAMGGWGMGAIIAPAIGPTLGGYMVDGLGWRSIFYVNLPVGIVAVILAQRLLVEGPTRKMPFDFVGFGFLSAFLISTLLAVSEGQSRGWESSFIRVNELIAVCSLILFVASALSSEHPILDLSLFKVRNFTLASILGVFRSVGLFGSTFLLPVFMQNFMGYTATRAGEALMPGALIIAFVMPVAGRLSDRMGARPLALVGVVGTALAIFMLRNLGPRSEYHEIFWPLIVRGIGIGFLMAPITTVAMNSVAPQKIGMASGMLNLLQQIGGAVGISYVEVLLERRTEFQFVRLSESAGHSPILLARVNQLMHQAGAAGQKSLALLGMAAKRMAAARAFDDAYLVTAGIVLLGVIPALFLTRVASRARDVSAMAGHE
jgi:DHA2 family multidrug resistance protein